MTGPLLCCDIPNQPAVSTLVRQAGVLVKIGNYCQNLGLSCLPFSFQEKKRSSTTVPCSDYGYGCTPAGTNNLQSLSKMPLMFYLLDRCWWWVARIKLNLENSRIYISRVSKKARTIPRRCGSTELCLWTDPWNKWGLRKHISAACLLQALTDQLTSVCGYRSSYFSCPNLDWVAFFSSIAELDICRV